jgi:hypothetical protein
MNPQPWELQVVITRTHSGKVLQKCAKTEFGRIYKSWPADIFTSTFPAESWYKFGKNSSVKSKCNSWQIFLEYTQTCRI